jgi:hypothetical protein
LGDFRDAVFDQPGLVGVAHVVVVPTSAQS